MHISAILLVSLHAWAVAWTTSVCVESNVRHYRNFIISTLKTRSLSGIIIKPKDLYHYIVYRYWYNTNVNIWRLK